MKFIYVIILFLMFFNIFSVMFSVLGIIPYEYTVAGEIFTEDMTSEGLFKSLTDVSWDSITSAMLGNADIIALVLGGGALGILTRSPAPFAVGLFLGLFVNTFRRTTTTFSSFEVNEYMILAAMVGMLFLIIITVIEYLTQGDV